MNKKEQTIEQPRTQPRLSASTLQQRDHQTKIAVLTFTTQKFRKIGGEDEEESNIGVA